MQIINFIFGILSWVIKNADGNTVFVTILFTLITIGLLYQNRQLYKKYIASELIKQQMIKTETLIINTKKMLTENYLSLIAKKVGKHNRNEIMKSRDYHHFKFVLNDVIYELKSKMRFFFNENHLAIMTEIEFNNHIDKRAEEILNEFTKLLDDNYYQDSDPGRIELYDSQQSLTQKGKKMIEDCFREGRVLAQKFSTRKGRKEYNL
jgi:hypothetical protein